MIERLLIERKLPAIGVMDDGRPVTAELWPERRREMLDTLSKALYGVTPDVSARTRARMTGREGGNYWAGKAVNEHFELSIDLPGGSFTFPFHLVLPRSPKRPPLILQIAFRPDCPDRYMPAEEIIDRGFALAYFCYTDVVPDSHDGDFTRGLAALFIGDRPRRPDEWGRIGMWAYAASRVMDYLVTRDDIDTARIAVAGHSRLGKTALWCAAQDERFFAALANDTGYGGAGLARGHVGEQIGDFIGLGSWDWFAENFKLFDNREDVLPYDQHFLLACHAPRRVCVGSAADDQCVDFLSDFLSCAAGGRAWENLGLPGFLSHDRPPEPGESYHGGHIGYHVREGGHFFSRYDWNRYMDFIGASAGER